MSVRNLCTEFQFHIGKYLTEYHTAYLNESLIYIFSFRTVNRPIMFTFYTFNLHLRMPMRNLHIGFQFFFRNLPY